MINDIMKMFENLIRLLAPYIIIGLIIFMIVVPILSIWDWSLSRKEIGKNMEGLECPECGTNIHVVDCKHCGSTICDFCGSIIIDEGKPMIGKKKKGDKKK